MANEFLNAQYQEQARVRAEKMDFLVQEVKRLVIMVGGLKQDIRTVREDLRNFDKLRPLKIKEEITQ